jgi:ribosomal protein L5
MSSDTKENKQMTLEEIEAIIGKRPETYKDRNAYSRWFYQKTIQIGKDVKIINPVKIAVVVEKKDMSDDEIEKIIGKKPNRKLEKNAYDRWYRAKRKLLGTDVEYKKRDAIRKSKYYYNVLKPNKESKNSLSTIQI